MGISINILDILREPKDGLAMSSRNVYLSPKERIAASILFQSLCTAQKLFEEKFLVDSESKLDANVVKEAVIAVLKSEPLMTELQYVSVDSKDTMTSLLEIGSDGAVVSIACKIGNVRLIDNVILH